MRSEPTSTLWVQPSFEAVALVPPTQVPEGLAWSAWSAYLAEAKPPAPRSDPPEIPHDLEAIVMKAIERNPHRRYESSAAMADDLERFLTGQRVLAKSYLHQVSRRAEGFAGLA